MTMKQPLFYNWLYYMVEELVYI